MAATDPLWNQDQRWRDVLASAQTFDDQSRAGKTWIRPVNARLVEAVMASSLAWCWPYWSHVTLAFATGPTPWTLTSSLDVPVALISGGEQYYVGKGYALRSEIILETADPVIDVQAAAELAEQWRAGGGPAGRS